MTARRPHTVLTLTSEYPPDALGGLGTHVHQLVLGGIRAGCRFIVVTVTQNETSISYDSGLIIRRVAPSPTTYQLQGQPLVDQVKSYNIDLAIDIDSFLSDQWLQPDIIHVHDWYLSDAAIHLGKQLGIPVVGTFHMLFDPLLRWWGERPDPLVTAQEAKLCRELDMIITVSQSMRQVIQQMHHVPDEQIRVVYNGIDPGAFHARQLSLEEQSYLRQSIAPGARKLVIYAGRIAPQKGISALITAAARVVGQAPDTHYLLIGKWSNSEFSTLIRDRLQEYPVLQEKITLIDHVPREQLAQFYQIADLALVPSIYEPFGYAAIEAMAMGVPVVATNVGGLAEIIQDRESGLLVPVHTLPNRTYCVDIEQLAAAQMSILDNDHLAQQLGEACRRRALGQFHLEKMVQSTLDVYHETLERFQHINAGVEDSAGKRYKVA
jgi:glycosyltransferase involved in cell wall biosynthesis